VSADIVWASDAAASIAPHSRPFTTIGQATSAVNATVGVEATGYFVIAEALTNTADVPVLPAPDRGDEGTREGRTGA